MIKKNFIGLCLLTGLALVSCKKNEARKETVAKDSVTVSQPVEKMDSPAPETTDSAAAGTPQKYPKETGTADASKSIEGKYVSKNCEGFTIEVKSIADKTTFKISDKTKVIASGNASTAPSDGGMGILMGEIGGVFQGDKLEIQNTGNNMNPYQHFDCPEKYMEFVKQK